MFFAQDWFIFHFSLHNNNVLRISSEFLSRLTHSNISHALIILKMRKKRVLQIKLKIYGNVYHKYHFLILIF